MKLLGEVLNRELAPTGTHTALLFRIIDLGTHTKTSELYGTKTNREIRFDWELSEEKMTDGKAFGVSRTYNVVFGDRANLVIDLSPWVGEEIQSGWEPDSMLGKACNITVVHNKSKDGTKTYANVAAITPLKKGEATPDAINPITIFDLDEFDQATFDDLAPYFREIIEKSEEYIALKGQSSTTEQPVQSLGSQPTPTTDESLGHAQQDIPVDEDLDDEIPF